LEAGVTEAKEEESEQPEEGKEASNEWAEL